MLTTDEEKLEKIKHYRPIDDVFFQVLADDKAVCREILQTILENQEIHVKDVKTQSSLQNLYGRSARLDALCELDEGIKANIEVQRANDDDQVKRIRFNASLITVYNSKTRDKFKDVIELYMVFISEFDLFKQGKTVYHIHKRIDETGNAIEDGIHEIYVNAAIDDGSDIAELMKCFMSEYVSHPKFPALSRRVKWIKVTKGGMEKMSSAMEELEERAVRYERLRQIKMLIGRGKTEEEIVGLIDYTPEEVQEARQELLEALSQAV